MFYIKNIEKTQNMFLFKSTKHKKCFYNYGCRNRLFTNYYIAACLLWCNWHKFYYNILKDATTPPSDGYGISFRVWSVRVPNSDPLLKFHKYSPAQQPSKDMD